MPKCSFLMGWMVLVLVAAHIQERLHAGAPPAAGDFLLVPAVDGNHCKTQGRVETHTYPRSVGRKMAMLSPGSSLTVTTEKSNISVILPPIFESPGPRYGNFQACRLRVRVDDRPWQELALATARAETIVAENLPAGKHTLVVEPVGGLAVVEAFRVSSQPLAGFFGTVVAEDYSENLTDVRVDLFQGDQLVRTDYVRQPRTGGVEVFGLSAGDYRVRIRAAGWIEQTLPSVTIKGPGQRLDVGVIVLHRDLRVGGSDGQDRPGPRFGHSLCVTPGATFTAGVNLPTLPIKKALLQSRFKSVALPVIEARKYPLGRWNSAGEATFQLPKDIPWDMYDLVLSFDTKLGEVKRVAGQAVCVRESLPAEFHVAGCGHMNTWGQQTAEYLTRVAEVAELAGARTLLIANEVNPAYIAGALMDLRIPYVVCAGNHTMPRWSDFYGASSRAVDDGPMRIVTFGRWPYESWGEVERLFQARAQASNRIIVCYESFAPTALMREQKISLLFDAHSDDAHPERDAIPERTFRMRAPTQETLRWIPMTHQGIAPAAKTNSDVPVLTVPRTGAAPLRVEFAERTDGSASRQVATITNETETVFLRGRVRLVLRRGAYQSDQGKVLQAFDADDGTRTVLDLEVAIPAHSKVLLRVSPK